MGVCTCVRSLSLSSQSNLIVSSSQSATKDDTLTSFEYTLLSEINSVRTSPSEYANKLKQLLSNIIIENSTCFFVYNNKEKIVLQKGTHTFIEAIDYLKSLSPMNKLNWNDELKVRMTNVNKKISSIGNLILEKRTELLAKYDAIMFNLDIFSDPVLSVIFQITDEAFYHQRRNALLNKKFKMFAVTYTYDYNKKFMSISTLA